MSATEIYGFDQDGDAHQVGEVENAWRGAMAIWAEVERRYLPEYIPEWAKGMSNDFIQRFHKDGFSRLTDVLNLDAMKEILELFEKNEVSLVNKIVLGTTFDHVVVKREDMPRLMEAFRAFEGNTSLKEQADIIQAMYESGEWVAVAWNQTSVNADTWDQFDFDEDKAEPYNLNRFDKHWFLFDGIKDMDNN
jgi:hypothetical protein